MKINFILWENDDCQIQFVFWIKKVLKSFTKTKLLPGR